jgi:hypothetical protein
MLHAYTLASFTKPLILNHIFCLSLFTHKSVTVFYAESFEQLTGKYVTQPIIESQNYTSDTQCKP